MCIFCTGYPAGTGRTVDAILLDDNFNCSCFPKTGLCVIFHRQGSDIAYAVPKHLLGLKHIFWERITETGSG
jgi:hypothetical protein